MTLALRFGGGQQPLVSRRFTPTSASLCLCVSHLLLVRTRVTGSGAKPMGDLISRSLN